MNVDTSAPDPGRMVGIQVSALKGDNFPGVGWGEQAGKHYVTITAEGECQKTAPAERSFWDPLSFREAIRSLLSFSLIKRAAIDNICSVHPLVYSWSRDSMARREGSFFAHGLLSSSPGTRTPMAYNDERYTNYGLAFFEAGYWKGAEQMEVPVMETSKRVLGEEHPDMLRGMGNLASTYWNQGGLAAGSSSLGDDKEGPRGGTSIRADEHGKRHADIHRESGTVEGGRTTGGSYLGDEKESPRGPASRHAESTSNLTHTL